MSKQKPMPEKQTREQLLGWCRKYGCEAELLAIFARYDDALKGCKTTEEQKAVQAMGVMEVNRFFGKAALNVKYNDGSSIVIGNDGNIIKGT